MSRVLFVCLHNAGRSQISQALFERAAHGRHEARSAGTEPAAHVHPPVVETMRELGVDLAERAPRKLEREDAEWADVVVTMGCGEPALTSPASAISTGTWATPPVGRSRKCARSATRSPTASRGCSPSSTTRRPEHE